ncbi:MAG: class I SAM-dependent methyltransferase [Desulfobacterales bacterium]|nr:class I SAM-dependent methyltransferase [Desulfobacterales bacterium]
MIDNSDQRIVEKILQFTDLNNKQVLEIGCGNGRITALLVGKSEGLIAIDPNEAKIREARKKVSGVDFRIGTGENLEFSDQYFDLVIFTLSLHHQDSLTAIGEATRVLKDEGEILTIEPVIEGEVEQVFALVHDENQATIDAQQSIKESGLSIERSETFNAKWTFDTKEQLCQSIFEHYEMPFNTHTADKICRFLGAKAEHQPLELLDIMRIQSLKKI